MIAMLPPALLVARPLDMMMAPDAPLVAGPEAIVIVGDPEVPKVATLMVPVDVLNAPELPLKSIAFDPLAATPPENVPVPLTSSVELSVVA